MKLSRTTRRLVDFGTVAGLSMTLLGGVGPARAEAPAAALRAMVGRSVVLVLAEGVERRGELASVEETEVVLILDDRTVEVHPRATILTLRARETASATPGPTGPAPAAPSTASDRPAPLHEFATLEFGGIVSPPECERVPIAPDGDPIIDHCRGLLGGAFTARFRLLSGERSPFVEGMIGVGTLYDTDSPALRVAASWGGGEAADAGVTQPWADGRLQFRIGGGISTVGEPGELRIGGGFGGRGLWLDPMVGDRLEAMQVSPGSLGNLRLGGWFRLATDLKPPGAPLRLGPGFDWGLERGAAIVPYVSPDVSDEQNAEAADRARALNSDLLMTVGPNFRLVAPAKGPASLFLEWVGGLALDFRSPEAMPIYQEWGTSVSAVEVDPYMWFHVGVQIRAPGQGEAGR